jgi:hypothetical protein
MHKHTDGRIALSSALLQQVRKLAKKENGDLDAIKSERMKNHVMKKFINDSNLYFI